MPRENREWVLRAVRNGRLRSMDSCSAGLLAAHRKHGRAAREAASTFGAGGHRTRRIELYLYGHSAYVEFLYLYIFEGAVVCARKRPCIQLACYQAVGNGRCDSAVRHFFAFIAHRAASSQVRMRSL